MAIHLVNILTNLRRSAFVKNVFIMMSGSVASQVVGFALIPIISRLYSPADFGVAGSFFAVLGVIASGVTLGYSQAIVLPKEKKDAINLFILSCASTGLITACCLAVCLLAPTFLQDLMKTPNIWMLALLVVAILVSGLNIACSSWCVRVKAFKDTSASQVIRGLSSNGSQVALGYLKGGALSLVFGAIVGELLASLNVARVLFRDIGALRRDIRWVRIKQLAKDYRDFPMYSSTMEVINSLSQGLPVLLLSQFYGIAVAGAYAFGMRILSAPTGLILRSLREVLLQKATETYNLGGRLMPLYVKFTLGLLMLAIFPSLVFFIWAPQLFTWIFGPQWLTAGEYARFLMLWLAFMFCNLPSVLLARILRVQRQAFFFDLVLLALRTLVLIVGGMYMSALYTIILLSLVGAVMNIIFIVIIGYILMRHEGNATWKGILNSKILE